MGENTTYRGSEETPIVFPAIPWLVDGNRFEPLLEFALASIKAQEPSDSEVLPPFLSEPFPLGTTFNKKEEMCFLNIKLNEIIEVFLGSEATHLWFVDADAELPPDALNKLLKMDVDIASGISPPNFSRRKSTVLRWMPPASPEYEWSRPWYKAYSLRDAYGKIFGEDRIIATGHFCMLCKRHVFEPSSPEKPPLRFVYDPPQRLTNEVLFWQTAQELGFKCRINGEVLCGHLPNFPLELILGDFE